MKKTFLAAMAALLLFLSACQSPADPSETPTPDVPQPSQSAEALPSPVPSGEPVPSGGTLDFPDFLDQFTFLQADALVTGGDGLQYITYWLTPEDVAGLREAIQMDSWWEATDIPPMGLEASYALYDEENHSLTVNEWDEEKCLILAKDDNDGYLYFAPVSVLDSFEDYLSGLNFLPDFVRYFEFDQINVNRTPAEDGDHYTDYDVYLLDDAGQLSLLAALEPDTWTLARDSNELAVSWYAALELLDLGEDRIVIADWGEEKCLVNCFFSGSGPVVRYWAPASVLKNTQKLVDGLTSIGTIDYTAKRYYDLLWNDPGFDMLVTAATAGHGGISDGQIAAYALTVLGYEGLIDYEEGVPGSQLDEIARKHFGHPLGSYDTDWSKVLPSGNVTATGWDANFGLHAVLTGTPDVDEYGYISATFKLYTLGDDLWFDNKLDPSRLNHPREYLLAGRDSGYPAPQKLEVTFRIETEEVYGLQKEYLVYDSVSLAED